MEKEEKIENPKWVEEVQRFPGIIQQQIGNLCASVIASLVQIHFLSVPLYDAVIDDVESQLDLYFAKFECRNKETKNDD